MARDNKELHELYTSYKNVKRRKREARRNRIKEKEQCFKDLTLTETEEDYNGREDQKEPG